MASVGRIYSQSAKPKLRLLQAVSYRKVNSKVNLRAKRVVDVIGAVIALIVFAPVMLFVAVLVKLTSPGPVFFRQERLTLDEKPFEILKFRTMIVDAEAKTGHIWVQENDPRVTPIGKILRDTRLDEFPQLWNVLKGEMSLVGPRPERPVFITQFKKQGIVGCDLRHVTKAGIAGYAHVLYPNLSIDEIEKRIEADLYYIENWSLALDAWVLYKTTLLFVSFITRQIKILGRQLVSKLFSRKAIFSSAVEVPVPISIYATWVYEAKAK